MDTKCIIDVWSTLENMYNDVTVILHNSNKQSSNISTITITNNNDMKYLDVYLNDKFSQNYTHIHSFVNDMTSMYGSSIFQYYTLSCNHDFNIKKRHHRDDIEINDTKIKRMKYE